MQTSRPVTEIYHQIAELIERADSICIFRHVRPDCDAVGSQFGLKQWINDNFPKKKVYALGNETCSQGIWPSSDIVGDDTVKGSLAVVLDASTADRIDDDRWQLAHPVIRIDHHPDLKPFGDLSLINEKAAASCEILTHFFLHTGLQLSCKTAEYLYAGLLTDTLCFRTSNTTADTLKAAAALAEKEIRIPEINRELFDHSLKEFRFATKFRDHLEALAGERLGIVKLDRDELAAYGLSGSDARNHIDEIGHIRELQIWAVFTRHSGDDLYDASLRSKTIRINDTAARYGGGGHLNAAGIKDLTDAQVREVIALLEEKIRNN